MLGPLGDLQGTSLGRCVLAGYTSFVSTQQPLSLFLHQVYLYPLLFQSCFCFSLLAVVYQLHSLMYYISSEHRV